MVFKIRKQWSRDYKYHLKGYTLLIENKMSDGAFRYAMNYGSDSPFKPTV